MQIWRRPAF